MKKTPGRPPLDEDDDSVSVHLKMTAAQYDDTYARAAAARVSVQEIIRRDVEAATKRNTK